MSCVGAMVSILRYKQEVAGSNPPHVNLLFKLKMSSSQILSRDLIIHVMLHGCLRIKIQNWYQFCSHFVHYIRVYSQNCSCIIIATSVDSYISYKMNIIIENL